LIHIDLANILYPSTTTRAPRTIVKCLKLKANESRVLLLIGYPIFKKYLPETYFNHLKMLAFGVTIGESCNISSEKINEMEFLLSTFVDNFPYHERHIVQNIHSVKHFAKTVNDFGPLFNYSTFNYESIIGKIISKLFFSSYFCLPSFINRLPIVVNTWHQTSWCRIDNKSPVIQAGLFRIQALLFVVLSFFIHRLFRN
jgi:hypothetical protein